LVAYQKRAIFRTRVLKSTYEALAAANYGSTCMRGYYILLHDQEQIPRVRKNIADAWKSMDDAAAALKEQFPKLDSDEQKKLAADLIDHAAAWKAEQIESVRQLEAGGEGGEKVSQMVRTNSFIWPAKIRVDISSLLDSLNKKTVEEDKLGDQIARSANLIDIFGAIFVLGIGIGLVAFLTRHIALPLRDAARKIAQAEASNDLTAQVLAKSNDEVGEICVAFNSFMKKLHGAVAQTAGTAEQVASASEEIAAAAGQAAAGAESQQQHATQAATSMQEMTASVQQVADHSNTAAAAARSAAQAAKNGGQVVEASLASMRSIANSVSDSATKIAELGKRSDQIGRIVNVIDDIADQTNLLALNAAIEAARAGDQGRGFAVVADEVRKLAERTTTATKEIAEMITAMQEETKRAIDTMQAGTVQVQQGVEQTSQAGASLQEIIAAAEKVGDMVAQIATAATQQAATTQEVGTNVEQIAKITSESSAGAQQSARACHELSGLALELQNLVSQFRLSEAANPASAAPRSRNREVYRPTAARPDRTEKPKTAGKSNGHSPNGRTNDHDKSPHGIGTRVH